MTISSDAPISKKMQIANAIRAEIADGQPLAGYKLQSLRELANRFGVTAVTVSGALQILIDEGLVVSVPNRGYFVSDADAPDWDAEESETSAQGSPDYAALIRHLEVLDSTVRSLAERVARLESLIEAQD
ncbi:GntR family transcriptional regulator [Kitasatospora sp. NPDC090308]|uniref:GntR family transcriptional regulator n=1 Tax=Kitasatospora sp. NPDC090308 TaxID=3364082 RepID=UPI0037FF9AE4